MDIEADPAQRVIQYWFGQPPPDHPLDAASAEDLMARARARIPQAASVTHAEILNVLEATGRAWANPEYPLRKEALERLTAQLPFSEPMTRLTLSMLPGLLETETLRRRIRAELGSGGLRDGWIRGSDGGYSTLMRPRGVLVHVSAGNVFLGSVDSLVMGLVTRNVNILKLSRSDPYFPLAFVQSLAEHDPKGILTGSIAVVSWRGGDEAVESVLKQQADTIMVWGGEDSVRSYRNGLGLGTKLVEYGPSYPLRF